MLVANHTETPLGVSKWLEERLAWEKACHR